MGESVNQSSGLAALCQQFDHVYCISLPRSQDRRQYMESYFGELGIDYQIWNATDKADAIVEQYYHQGLVHQYPPCFRCGQYTCGNDNCNNVLIAAQVATFITYLSLWSEIVRSGVGRVLIVEDDIKFTPYAEQLAQQLVATKALDTLDFRADVPNLLRLGWGLGQEHKSADQVEIQPDLVRYSNPCHALTRAMAELLLDEFEAITTTVDIYQHKIVAAKANNYTVMPPLAYELSWSVGSFDSLIRPKQIRINYLREHQPQATAAIQQAQRSFKEHTAHILYRPLLIIGHPRCGSGYMSVLLKALGLDVGHERMGQDGISSWMFVADDTDLPYAQDRHSASTANKYFKHYIHYVREPRAAVPSIILENRYAPKAYAFRQKHIQNQFGVNLDDYTSELEKAVLSYVYWNKLANDRPVDLTVRVEDGEAKLLAFLKQVQLIEDIELSEVRSLPPKTVNTDKPYQGKRYDKPILTPSDWQAISPQSLTLLNEQCLAYGYAPIKINWLQRLWNLVRR